MLTALLGIMDSAIYNALGFFAVGLGVMVSIRFTGYPDLTADGSFTFGAAVYAATVSAGHPVLLGLLLSACAGILAGALTGTANVVLGIGRIIAGVLVFILLIILAPYLSGGGAIGLLNPDNFLAAVGGLDKWITSTLLPPVPFSLHFAFSLACASLLVPMALAVGWFFRTKIGIQIRYVGSSVSAGLLGHRRRGALTIAGLCIGNCLIALGGAIEAQRLGGFNQNMGMGVILVALTILVLGENLIGAKTHRDFLTVSQALVAVLVGVLVYTVGIQLLLVFGLSSMDVRLSTTLFLLALLAWSRKRGIHKDVLF